MNKKINHWCVICGKGYHACDTCLEIKNFTPWRTLTDTANHFQIYMTLISFRDGYITKEQAQKELANCDLTGKENFKDGVKGLLSEIFKEDNKEKSTPKRKANKKKVNVETETKDDDIVEVVEDDNNVEVLSETEE